MEPPDERIVLFVSAAAGDPRNPIVEHPGQPADYVHTDGTVWTWRTGIEWVGGVNPLVDDPEPCDFGPEASRRLEPVRFEDWRILVPPLDLQRAVNERRGLAHRVLMIDALQADDTLDVSVWRQPRLNPRSSEPCALPASGALYKPLV